MASARQPPARRIAAADGDRGRGPRDPRRQLALAGERLAARHMRDLGFSLLARNARTRHGEIDLIAFDGDTLVFAEVKTRRVRRSHAWRDAEQRPVAALRPGQQARLRRLAVAWLHEHPDRPSARTIRFDAIGVLVDARATPLGIEHLEGAW